MFLGWGSGSSGTKGDVLPPFLRHWPVPPPLYLPTPTPCLLLRNYSLAGWKDQEEEAVGAEGGDAFPLAQLGSGREPRTEVALSWDTHSASHQFPAPCAGRGR